MGRLDRMLEYVATKAPEDRRASSCAVCRVALTPENSSRTATLCRPCNTAYHRQHRQKNPDIYRQADRRYTQRHPEQVKKKIALRKQREAAAPGHMLQVDWYALCEWAGYRCLACGESAPLFPDHVVPITAGGSHDLENRQPLCRPCNSRKGVDRIDYRNPEALAVFLASRAKKAA